MSKTKVSSKYQVVIPKEVRLEANIKPGQKFHVITKSGVIWLVPDRPLSEARGMFPGLPTTGFREKKDRF